MWRWMETERKRKLLWISEHFVFRSSLELPTFRNMFFLSTFSSCHSALTSKWGISISYIHIYITYIHPIDCRVHLTRMARDETITSFFVQGTFCQYMYNLIIIHIHIRAYMAMASIHICLVCIYERCRNHSTPTRHTESTHIMSYTLVQASSTRRRMLNAVFTHLICSICLLYPTILQFCSKSVGWPRQIRC